MSPPIGAPSPVEEVAVAAGLYQAEDGLSATEEPGSRGIEGLIIFIRVLTGVSGLAYTCATGTWRLFCSSVTNGEGM